MRRWKVFLCALAFAGPLAINGALAARPVQENEATATISRGRAAAVSRCQRCHAIEHQTQSPRAAAPPFKVIATRYSSDGLQLELQNIAEIGHHEMQPTFVELSVRKDLIAYIQSLR